MSEHQLNWPVDGHVHFHNVGRVAPTLDAAVANFRAAGGPGDGLVGGLLLTQAAGEQVFEALRNVPSAGDWTLDPVAAEPETLIARNGRVSVAVVCGRQVRAADGLEVLALGTCSSFADGLPFREAIETVRRSGALTAVPWGFGKWLGQRGKRVEAELASLGPGTLFVGDNSNRLGLLGVPPLVRSFDERGFRVLPGTDPFPFGGDQRRVGRFGFLADLQVTEAAPWRMLRSWLEARQQSPQPYGRALGPVGFLFNQFGIQVYNRAFRKPSIPSA